MDDLPEDVASMRPQLFAADYHDPARPKIRATGSFNEAAAIRCGSPGCRSKLQHLFLNSFNEAAAIRCGSPAMRVLMA